LPFAKIHRVVDAGELAARHFEVARPFGATGHRDRIEIGEQFLHADRHADLGRGAELDPLRRHLLDAAIDQVLFHLEVGDAVAQ
jgi:hypothetical protein